MTSYGAALAFFPKITYKRYQKIRRYFSDFKNLWLAEFDEMVAAGLEEEIAHEFILWRGEHPAEGFEETLAKEGIATVSLGEPGYPGLLGEITDPPLTLFVRGRLPPEKQPALGVVGTRRHSLYGKQVVYELARALAARGLVIVSGLALGIDGFSHEAALESGGLTVAVLGSGVDRRHIYPASHQQLAERIIAGGGAVISEYPPGFAPTQYSFPARNRIIAGLTLGTLVIEAPEESGALITARCALDYNREVFAVPHPLTSATGAGGNELIKLGARLVTKPEDITEALNLKSLKEISRNPRPAPASPLEALILAKLSQEPKHVDTLAKETGLDSSGINSTLALMEIKGRVKNLGGMNYVLNKF